MLRSGSCKLQNANLTELWYVQVVVPPTFFDYTSRRVLTTGWLSGEKLSQSTADDVGSLVNIGVICYLKQLLDTGLFHADECLSHAPSVAHALQCIGQLTLKEHASNQHGNGIFE